MKRPETARTQHGRRRSRQAFGPWARVWLVLAALPMALALAQPVPPPPPAADARCPVCGMQVAPHKAWLATIIFTTGKRVDFDGPKDMFRYYFDLAKFEKKLGPKDIREIWVTDYYTAKPVDARTAWFVAGSDVLGPMGHELVPVAGKQESVSFRTDHHGLEVLSFAGVTRSVVEAIE